MTDNPSLERIGVLLDRSAVSKVRRIAMLELHPDGVLTGWRRVRLLPSEVEELRAFATVLPELAKCGHGLYTYSELLAEGMRASIPINFHPAGDLLRGVQLQHAREPICRAKVMGSRTLKQVACRDDVITFVERLLTHATFWPQMEQNFSDFEMGNAANRDRLRVLCANLDRKQFSDALHLWTAEVNNLRYFLTMDQRFCNVMRKTKQIQLICTPVRPSDLMNELGISKFVPCTALDDTEWHPFHEGHP